MIAPISDVHKPPDAALDISFLKSPLIDGKYHLADHVVTVVARQMSRDDGIDAIQEAASRKAQGGGQRLEFRSLDHRHLRKQLRRLGHDDASGAFKPKFVDFAADCSNREVAIEFRVNQAGYFLK